MRSHVGGVVADGVGMMKLVSKVDEDHVRNLQRRRFDDNIGSRVVRLDSRNTQLVDDENLDSHHSLHEDERAR